MARKDNRPYTFHCTEKTPFRGGLRPDVSILHDSAHQSFSNGKRTCRWCHADLGLNFERSWEREERIAKAKESMADNQKASAELIRRVSLSIDDRNGKKPQPKAQPVKAETTGPDGIVG